MAATIQFVGVGYIQNRETKTLRDHQVGMHKENFAKYISTLSRFSYQVKMVVYQMTEGGNCVIIICYVPKVDQYPEGLLLRGHCQSGLCIFSPAEVLHSL